MSFRIPTSPTQTETLTSHLGRLKVSSNEAMYRIKQAFEDAEVNNALFNRIFLGWMASDDAKTKADTKIRELLPRILMILQGGDKPVEDIGDANRWVEILTTAFRNYTFNSLRTGLGQEI